MNNLIEADIGNRVEECDRSRGCWLVRRLNKEDEHRIFLFEARSKELFLSGKIDHMLSDI